MKKSFFLSPRMFWTKKKNNDRGKKTSTDEFVVRLIYCQIYTEPRPIIGQQEQKCVEMKKKRNIIFATVGCGGGNSGFRIVYGGRTRKIRIHTFLYYIRVYDIFRFGG